MSQQQDEPKPSNDEEQLLALLAAGSPYSVWTPIDAYEAAAILLRELEKEKASRASQPEK